MFTMEYRYNDSGYYSLTDWSSYDCYVRGNPLMRLYNEFPGYGVGDSYRFRMVWED